MRISRSAALPLFAVENRPFEQDIVTALDPQQSTRRFNRTWRLSRLQRFEGEPFLWGKLGFLKAPTASEVQYDDVKEDFIVVPGPKEHGQFAYFVLDVVDRYMVFEERQPDIKRGSFLGALKAILSQSESPNALFEVDLVTDPDEFMAWLDRTERVSRFFVSMRQPNPTFDPREDAVRRFMEESNAASLNIEAKPPKDGPGLEIRGSDLGRFVEYVSQGYGTIKGTGETQEKRTFFDSDRKVVSTDMDVERGEPETSILAKMKDRLKSIVPQ